MRLLGISPQTLTNFVICPQAGRAFTLCLQLQRVNRESRRYACSPKNYHFAALEAMNSVRKETIMSPCMLQLNLKQHCFLTAPLHDISKACIRGGAATREKHPPTNFLVNILRQFVNTIQPRRSNNCNASYSIITQLAAERRKIGRRMHVQHTVALPTQTKPRRGDRVGFHHSLYTLTLPG